MIEKIISFCIMSENHKKHSCIFLEKFLQLVMSKLESIIDDLISITNLDPIISIHINRILSCDNFHNIVNILSQHLSLAVQTKALLKDLLSTHTWNEVIAKCNSMLNSFDILRVKCITAIELNRKQKIDLYKKIMEIYQLKYHRIHILFTVDIDIIGGMIIEINFKRYDYSYLSLRNKLQNILFDKMGVM